MTHRIVLKPAGSTPACPAGRRPWVTLGLSAILSLGLGASAGLAQGAASPSAPTPADTATDRLASDRWESRAHGLSLRPPLGAQLLELSADDAIVRIGHPDGYKITLYVKQSKRELTLEEVVKSAVEQAATSPTTVRKVEDPRAVTIGGLEGKVFSFAAPDVTPPAVLAQAFAMLGPQKVLIIELNSEPTLYERARQAFDQVVASVAVLDPAQIAQQRRQLLEAGQAWLKGVTPQTLHDALQAEQWFRIIEGQRDIGYMRIRQKRDQAMRLDGVRIDVQSRLIVDQLAYDTLANYFTSDDRTPDRMTEVWSVRTTARPLPNAAHAGQSADATPPSSWAETGLLSKGTLTLTRQSPQEKKPYQWSELPAGYISQVHAQLLTAMIGPADRQPMAFYAYDSRSGNLTLRSDRVEAANDGSYRVHTRLSPEQPEQVTHYDRQGKFIRRDLPGGQSIVPATAQQIVARWNLQSNTRK